MKRKQFIRKILLVLFLTLFFINIIAKEKFMII